MRIIRVIAVACVAIIISACSSESDEPKYVRIASTESSSDITMFFWYRCPACYRAEKEISGWIKEKNVTIEYRHSAIWEDDAKLFYTLDLLGLTDQYQSDLMDYFRKASNPSLSGIVKVIDNKYSEDDIRRRINSTHVMNRVLSTRSYEQHVGSNGVPLIVVNNEYALVGRGLSSGNITSTIEKILSK